MDNKLYGYHISKSVGECWGKVEGLSKKEKELMDRDHSVVITAGRWVGGGGKGYRGINGDRKINK